MTMRNMERNILALYDICDPKRLSKVAKTLEGYGMRVQQSVFELNITPGKLKELHEEVNTIIDNREDSVRYYMLCKEDWQKRQSIGVSNFEEPDWDKKFFVV